MQAMYDFSLNVDLMCLQERYVEEGPENNDICPEEEVIIGNFILNDSNANRIYSHVTQDFCKSRVVSSQFYGIKVIFHE